MSSLCMKKIMAVWSLCLLGGMGDVPEPELPNLDGCPKWFVVIKYQGLPVCGGALITHIMAITSCDCVSAEYETFVIRRPVAYFTIRIEQTKTDVNVDMIVPHPMCELNITEFPKFGTALVKVAWAISLDPKTVMPAPLYTLMLESEFSQFEKLLAMPVMKCGVMVKPLSGFYSYSNADCRFEAGVVSYVNVKLYTPANCLKFCLLAHNASCPRDMRDYDVYCLRVLSGGAKSYDPVHGTPLICDNRVWGLMFNFPHDIDNIYFFYGLRSVVEIYSMGVAYSVGNDCGGNKIVIARIHSRRADDAVNLHSPSSLSSLVLVILCTSYFQY